MQNLYLFLLIYISQGCRERIAREAIVEFLTRIFNDEGFIEKNFIVNLIHKKFLAISIVLARY
jgi:hypothetical protein